jgi:hypothetical protein
VTANGRYAVFAEITPTALQIGARPSNDDTSPYFNAWIKYCAVESKCSSLHFPAGNWVFNTKPDAIFTQGFSYGLMITGEGMQATVFYPYYSTSSYFGMFHLLPNVSGGGLVIRDIGIIGQNSNNNGTGGTGIAAHDGHTQYVTINSVVASTTITLTINGTAVVTNLGAGNQHDAAYLVAASINSTASLVNGTSMLLAVPSDNKVVILSRATVPATVTVSATGGTSVSAPNVLGSVTCGYIVIDGVNITGANNAWSWSLLLDGNRKDDNPLGIRSIFMVSSNFFGALSAAVSVRGCDNIGFSNCQVVLAGGSSGSLEITGIAGHPTENWFFSGGFISDLRLDYASFGVITTGKILAGVTNTANTTSVKILAGFIAPPMQTNWTASAYL